MDIEKMHIVFREFAQKFGMQNVRAILDEDIDICLNTSINTEVREILIGGTNQTPYADRLIRQNVSIAPINALRNLYSKAIISGDQIYTKYDTESSSDTNTDSLTEEDEDNKFANSTSDNKKEPPSETNPYIISNNQFSLYSIFIITGFKVSYDDNAIYDCRIIEVEDLGSTFRDYCNRPTYDAPIVTLFNNGDEQEAEIYTGNNSKYTNKTNFKKPHKVYITYIKKPKEVKYDKHNSANNVNCDLPDYLHDKIVLRAAQLFTESININANQNNNSQNK